MEQQYKSQPNRGPKPAGTPCNWIFCPAKLSQVETCRASIRPYERVRVCLLLGAEQVRVHRGRLVVERLEKVLGAERPQRVS